MDTDTKILTALRGVSGASTIELARKVGLTTDGLKKRIDDLRLRGYVIESTPHQGFRLVGAPDLLHPDDLASRLAKDRIIGRDIRVFQETTSTSDVIEKLARDGVKEGVVAFAESQTKGRGRHGRVWVSPKGKGLWFSVLLRPEFPPAQVTQLTVASAVAVWRAMQNLRDIKPEIKWPNDLLIGGKKVAGILTELSAELDRVRYVNLGIGVNVNLEPRDFAPELRPLATSLRIESGAKVNRPELAASILRELDEAYRFLLEGRFSELADEWESHCSTLGKQVVIQQGLKKIHGRVESLDEEGALLLRTEHGHLERIIGGDVTLEKTRSRL